MGTTLKFLSENTVRKCTFGKRRGHVCARGDEVSSGARGWLGGSPGGLPGFLVGGCGRAGEYDHVADEIEIEEAI